MSTIKVASTEIVMKGSPVIYTAASKEDLAEEELEKLIKDNIECSISLPTLSKEYE